MSKSKLHSCHENLTPPSPPLTGGGLESSSPGGLESSSSGGLESSSSGGLESSSPVKGRRGRGLSFAAEKERVMSGVLPYNKNLTDRAREHRKNPTTAESKIWNEVLRMRQFANYKFLRQKPIDNYIVDFYCSEFRLVIEIDGESHADTVEYDAERTRVLQSLGLTVVRYTNDDVIQNIQGVYDDLSERIEKLTQGKPLPRLPLSGEEPKTCLSPSLDKGRAGEGFNGGGQ
jgi:very-short-patch-repair endonuclease